MRSFPYTNRVSIHRKDLPMRVYLIKDIEKVGVSGEIIKVSDGHAINYLIPRGFALEVTPATQALFEKKAREVQNRKQVIESKTSILAEKIKSLKLVIKRKVHDNGLLYGAVGQTELAELLTKEGFKVAKNQIIMDEPIKEKGSFHFTVKLSNSLQPHCTVKVISE